MKTIIAGSRGIEDYETVCKAMAESGFIVSEVVSGTARGVDRLGEQWAQMRQIPVKRFPAQWSKHGKSAGPMRNREMADYADALVAVWDGKSRGTQDMISSAKIRGLEVHVYRAAS